MSAAIAKIRSEAIDDRYSLVSSFYGPGATACWYLTILACLVSWTIHPKKRKSGSIESDFVAVLTFPTVAAAHLISQTYHYKSNGGTLNQEEDEGGAISKLRAAIEASLTITETSLMVCVGFFLIAVGFRCVKRAAFLAFVGLFSFSAEIYLYVDRPLPRRKPAYLSRLFLIDFTNLMIAISILLAILFIITLSLATTFVVRRRHRFPAGSDDPDHSRVSEVQSDPFLGSLYAVLMRYSTFLFLPAGLIASSVPIILSSVPIILNSVPASRPAGIRWIRTISRLLRDLFPRTNVSIKELDQAVAVLAGATILGFSLYGAAEAQYHLYCEKVRSQQENQRAERIRMRQMHSRWTRSRNSESN